MTAAASGSVPERSMRPDSPKVQLAKTGRSVHGLGREHRAARLGDVGHRLDEDRVGVLGGERGGLLGERGEDLVERRGAERLHHQAGRAHVGEHVRRAVALRDAHRRAVELLDAVAEPVLGELGARAAEGVGGRAVGARELVEAVDVADHLRCGDVEQLGALAGGQPGALQHRAHRAVEHEHLAAEALHDVRHRFDPFVARGTSVSRRVLSPSVPPRSARPSTTCVPMNNVASTIISASGLKPN